MVFSFHKLEDKKVLMLAGYIFILLVSLFAYYMRDYALKPTLLHFESYKKGEWNSEIRNIPRKLIRQKNQKIERILKELSYGPNYPDKLSFWSKDLILDRVFFLNRKTLMVSVVSSNFTEETKLEPKIDTILDSIDIGSVEKLRRGLTKNLGSYTIDLYVNGFLWKDILTFKENKNTK